MPRGRLSQARCLCHVGKLPQAKCLCHGALFRLECGQRGWQTAFARYWLIGQTKAVGYHLIIAIREGLTRFGLTETLLSTKR